MNYPDITTKEKNGKNIAPDFGEDVYIGDNGEIFWYLGWIPNENHGSRSYYTIKKPKSKQNDNYSKDYARVKYGVVHRDCWFDEYKYCTRKFKLIDKVYVRRPSGTKIDFGVFNSQGIEDEYLTREIFGCTTKDLDDFLNVFTRTFLNNTNNEYIRYPKVTRSNSKENFCDITGAWIPDQFPYIVNAGQNEFTSHISLSGFYNFISFFLYGHYNLSKDMLLAAGASDFVIKRICAMPYQNLRPILSVRGLHNSI